MGKSFSQIAVTSRSPWRSRSVIGCSPAGPFVRTQRRALAAGLRARYRAVTVAWLRSAGAHHTARQRAPCRSA
jgi:hypothetical protein